MANLQKGRFNAPKKTKSPRGEAWANPSKGGNANASGDRGETTKSSFTTKKTR